MKAKLVNLGNTMLAFPTPIQQVRYDRIDEFNAEIARKILALRDASAGRQRSNVGGWHGAGTILQDLGEPFGTQLGKMFIENVKAAVVSMVEFTEPWPTQFSMDAWANVNERGDTNSAHIHPGCLWSGVYYIATDMDSGGEIVFSDPRTAALMISNTLNPFTSTNSVKVTPVPGLMLVFPSFVYHSVKPYEGRSPRISIAFNLR